MSLDIVVWLSCTVMLPQALPNEGAWQHDRITAARLEGMPKELAALLEGHESWNDDQSDYILRASYASKDPLTPEKLKAAVPQLDITFTSIDGAIDGDVMSPAQRRRQVALEARARAAPNGVSLVLEGVTESSAKVPYGVARHLARTCGGAVLETPEGYVELDERGEPVE